jgi:hypothetical protein
MDWALAIGVKSCWECCGTGSGRVDIFLRELDLDPYPLQPSVMLNAECFFIAKCHFKCSNHDIYDADEKDIAM